MALFRREKAAPPPSSSPRGPVESTTSRTNARSAKTPVGRRPHPGLLRRERRSLLDVRDERLRDLGGLTVEMYRRGAWREDLLHERCAEVIGIDARLAEIDELLHGSDGMERCQCGASVLRGSHFCPNCGRLLDREGGGHGGQNVAEDTVIAPPRLPS